MKKVMLFGLLLISASAFAGDKFQLVCKGFSGDIKLQAELDVPANLFQGSTYNPNLGMDQATFDPVAVAAQISGVAADGSKSFQVSLDEEKNYAGSQDVSGYRLRIWFGTPNQPTITGFIHSFLEVWSKNGGGNSVLGPAIIGSSTDGPLSVLAGTVNDWTKGKNGDSRVLCRLLP